jgi:cysteine synthase
VHYCICFYEFGQQLAAGSIKLTKHKKFDMISFMTLTHKTDMQPQWTELQARVDDRMRGLLGEYSLMREVTVPYQLEREDLYGRVDSMVGHTPLLFVEEVEGSKILAKVESQNPTENHYDRVFPLTIRTLEQDGVIKPGDELVEVTSGSGGRAFAWAAKVLGYKATVLIPPTLPAGRVQDMINFGANVEVVEPVSGEQGYMDTVSREYGERIKELEADGWTISKHVTRKYFVINATKDGQTKCFVNHSANPVTVDGFEKIGDEISEQLPLGDRVDYIVSVMGNGTSTTALSRSMRRHHPEVKVIGVEDQRSPRYYAEKHPGRYEAEFGRPVEYAQHDMFGSSAPDVRLRYGKVDVVDAVRLSDPDVRNTIRDEYNARKPGYEKIGNSSAASLDVARQLAKENPGSTIVVVFYDKADQYGAPVIDRSPKFLYDRTRPEGVPRRGWRQKQVSDISQLPRSISQANGQH